MFTVYQITNRANGKIYIGKHACSKYCTVLPDGTCSYMGSGASRYGGGLKAAKIKYGIDQFSKEILFHFDSEEEMNTKEAELVTEEFVRRDDTYNLCVGGMGGAMPPEINEQRKQTLRDYWKSPESSDHRFAIKEARRGSGNPMFGKKANSKHVKYNGKAYLSMTDMSKAEGISMYRIRGMIARNEVEMQK